MKIMPEKYYRNSVILAALIIFGVTLLPPKLVLAANHAPTLSAVSLATAEDTPVRFTIAGADADGDSLTYSIYRDSIATRGAATVTGNQVTFTPAPNYNVGISGAATFSVRAYDGKLYSSAAIISVEITAVADPAAANAVSVNALENVKSDAFALSGRGPDGQRISSYTIVTNPSHGTVTLHTGAWYYYTGSTDFNGTDSFTYKVTDIDGNVSEPATVSVTVAAVEDASSATEESSNNSLSPISATDIADCEAHPEASACTACPDALYDKTVYVAVDTPSDVTDFVNDEFIPFLNQATSETFTLSTYTAESLDDATTYGIFLVYSKNATALLDTKDDAYEIAAEPGKLKITAKKAEGLAHAGYDYLERLGFRWYGMQAHWTITPSLSVICLEAGEVVADPRFETYESGTGLGAYIKSPIGGYIFDMYGAQERIDLWQKRLRQPVTYDAPAHSYISIIDRNTTAFAADPLLMAEVDGARTSHLKTGTPRKFHYTYHGKITCDETMTPTYTASDGTKSCEDPTNYTANDGIGKLVSVDRIAALKELITANPDTPTTHYISVEPSDGASDCNCEKCKNLLRNGPYGVLSTEDSSVSDRVFYLSNLVAKAIAADADLGSDYGVGLLAYGYHGKVPTIPLEPNMNIYVVPYGYNYTGLPGDDLLNAWSDKKTAMGDNSFKLGIYDYLCVTVFAYDLPNGCPFQERIDRLNLFAEKGFENIELEASYGFGPTGLYQYAASHEVWQESVSTSILDEFYEKAFGPAEDSIRDYFSQIIDLRMDLRAIDTMATALVDASAKATAAGYAEDSDLIKRIDDLMKYAYFIRLSYNEQEAWTLAATSSSYSDHQSKMYDLWKYIWQIANDDLVHAKYLTYFAYEQRMRDWSDADKTAFLAKWPATDTSGTGWADVVSATPLTHTELLRLMNESSALSTATAVAVDYSDDYVPLVTDASTIDPAARITTPTFSYGNTFKIYARKTAKQSFNMTVTLKYDTSRIHATLTSSDGTELWEENYNSDTMSVGDAGAKTEMIEFDGTAGELYTLLVTSNTVGSYKFDFPLTMPFAAVDQYSVYPYYAGKQYIYVPKDVNVIGIDLVPSTEPTYYNPAGVAVATTKNGYNSFELDSSSHMGELWSFAKTRMRPGADYVMKLIGVPSVFGFDPQSMLVPKEVLPE
jgi:hypothetical protein